MPNPARCTLGLEASHLCGKPSFGSGGRVVADAQGMCASVLGAIEGLGEGHDD